MALTIHSFQFNAFQENSYLVWDEDKNCLIIDPGCYTSDEKKEFAEFIEANDLKPIALLSTHAHIDHVLGNAFVIEKYKIDFYMHPGDLTTLNAVASYAHLYGFDGYVPSPQPTHLLENEKELTFGKIKLKVYHTPGHSPGHVVFHFEEDKVLINGDVLFQGSFGRVDLPGGDIETLKKSIFSILFQLPDETKVFCGHGPETSIGREKKFNYILQF